MRPAKPLEEAMKYLPLLALLAFAPPSQAATTPLHDAASKLIRNFVCSGGERCVKKHGPRLTKAAHTVVDVCLSEPNVPKWMCLGFVAAISNEAGGLEHPTCGGLDQACVVECDKLRAGGARQSCFLQCARDQGISPSKKKHSRWQRIKRCNDRGTSRGPFQQKPKSVRACRNITGNPAYDPHNLEQSARCTIRKVRSSAYRKHWPCRRDDGDRWAIAMKRVGRGPLETIEKAKPRTWVPSPTGEGRWEEARPAKRIQRCTESRYALRGMRYYRACGKACSEVDKRLSLGETLSDSGGM
jgi:hypothetical protein